MSATDFLPRREADLRSWSRNFNARLVASPPGFYGLTADQVASYTQLHASFDDAYMRAHTPDTRTKPAVQHKNDTQQVLRRTARRFARVIHAHPGVTDTQKAALGLTIRRGGGRQPLLPVPQSRPWLIVDARTRGRVRIRLRDSARPFRTGRPIGVMGAILFHWVGDDPPDDVSRWTLWAMTTKTTVDLTLPHHAPPGTTVWLTAHWVNPRQEPGPLARPVRTHTPIGCVSLPVRRMARAA